MRNFVTNCPQIIKFASRLIVNKNNYTFFFRLNHQHYYFPTTKLCNIYSLINEICITFFNLQKMSQTAQSFLNELHSLETHLLSHPLLPLPTDPFNPGTSYSQAQSRLIDLELQRDDALRQIQLHQQLRLRDQASHDQRIIGLQQQFDQQYAQLQEQLGNRLEKQIGMIEQLIGDKKRLQERVEGLMEEGRVKEGERERMVKEMGVKQQKEREVWMAQEKVRREKWEAERTAQIRAQAFQTLEPTLQGLVEKNKEEVRKAFEDCERRVEGMKQQMRQEREELYEQLSKERVNFKQAMLEESKRADQLRLRENQALQNEISTLLQSHQAQLVHLQTVFNSKLEEALSIPDQDMQQVLRKSLRQITELEVELTLIKEQLRLSEYQRDQMREDLVAFGQQLEPDMEAEVIETNGGAGIEQVGRHTFYGGQREGFVGERLDGVKFSKTTSKPWKKVQFK